MARHCHEFYCTNCSWWNYPMIADTMDGNYEIVCGHCGHIHYRVIKDGVVIDDRVQTDARHGDSRWNKGADKWAGDTIHVMPSAAQEERRTLATVTALRQKDAAGLTEDPGGTFAKLVRKVRGR